jgi:hypothetical protein
MLSQFYSVSPALTAFILPTHSFTHSFTHSPRGKVLSIDMKYVKLLSVDPDTQLNSITLVPLPFVYKAAIIIESPVFKKPKYQPVQVAKTK